MLTVRDVAVLLKVSQGAVYTLVESGVLPHHRIGAGRGVIRIREDDLDRYIDSCRVDTTTNDERRVHIARRKLRHIKL